MSSSVNNHQKLLKIAENATLESASLIMANFGKKTQNWQKSDSSLVTEIDIRSEELIIKYLNDQTPNYPILSEEIEKQKIQNAEYAWIVDPLDGTSNYNKNLPWFAVQIALIHKGEVALGVINLPYENLMISSIKGGGLFINGEKVEISETFEGETTMLFETYLDNQDLEILQRFVSKVKNVRIINSACTSMAYLALGRVNVVVDRVDKPWDLAAASVIVEECGGKITNLSGGPFDLFNPQCIATKGFDHDLAVSLINSK